MRVINFDAKNVSGLTFSADGRYLAVGGRTRLFEVHDLYDRDPVAAGVVSDFHPRLAFHPRLPLLLAASRDFAMYTRMPGYFARPVDLLPHADRFALSPDGGTVVVSGRFDLALAGHRIRAFGVTDDGRLLDRWADPSDTEANLHLGLCWIPGTDRFAAVEWGGTHPDETALIVVRDAATGEVVASQSRSGLPADELTAGPDGTLVAVYRTTLSVWPAADLGHQPRVVRNDNRKHFTGVAFHPSGKYLAATSNDATVKLYDTATWGVARAFTWDIGKMRSIAFSPDGTLAAAGSENGKVVVWDVDV